MVGEAGTRINTLANYGIDREGGRIVPDPSVLYSPLFSEDGANVAFGVEKDSQIYVYLDFRKIHDDADLWDKITTRLDNGTVVVKKDPH